MEEMKRGQRDEVKMKMLDFFQSSYALFIRQAMAYCISKSIVIAEN